MNDNFADNITPPIEQKSYDKDLPKGGTGSTQQ